MIKQHMWHGIPVWTMDNGLLSVSLCPSLGNNAYRIWDYAREREVLRVPDHPDVLEEQPIQYGTPVLLPPNRIREGRFEYRGTTYQFDINTPAGHHIHGIIKNAQWKLESTETEQDRLTITSVLHTADFPEVLRQYPHRLELTMTYELTGSTLTQTLRAANAGDEPAPFGFGLHTWFMLDGQPDKWTLQVPVSHVWELDETLMPTGTFQSLGELAGLPEGISLAGRNLDTVFQASGSPNAAVLSHEDGYDIRYTASSPYKQWVIFTKGMADEFICLEPYTWVTNAPNVDLPEETTGLYAVAPGESIDLKVTLDIVSKKEGSA